MEGSDSHYRIQVDVSFHIAYALGQQVSLASSLSHSDNDLYNIVVLVLLGIVFRNIEGCTCLRQFAIKCTCRRSKIRFVSVS